MENQKKMTVREIQPAAAKRKKRERKIKKE